MIDLNSSEYDGTLIFNDGIAGVAENVKVSVGKKQADEPEAYPDYRIVFTASNGASISKGLYYLDESLPEADLKKRLTGLGAELKHVWHALNGSDVPIPKFETLKEMVDTMFAKFREIITADPDKLYRVTVDYGSEQYPQRYLRVQMYPPYLESMTVPKEESRLQLRRNARTTPLIPDSKDATYEEVHTGVEGSTSWA